jgi:TrmH family RNA methyltransferase
MGLEKKEAALIRFLRTRHGRKRLASCICEGVKSCRELLALKPEIIEFGIRSESFADAAFASVDLKLVSDSEFAALSCFENPEGIMFIFRRPDTDPKNDMDYGVDFIMLADRISDPGNLGTIIRTSRACALKRICLVKGGADPFAPKSIRAALASQFAIGITEFEDISSAICEFRRNSFNRIFKTDPGGGVDFYLEKDLFNKSVIIFGNEAHGTAPLEGSVPVQIPMPGKAESLNVAQAFTLVIYESIRRGHGVALLQLPQR